MSNERSQEDFDRRDKLYKVLNKYSPYDNALDLNCADGFISEFLPAVTIHGIQFDDTSHKFLPPIVKKLSAPEERYDLVMANEILYSINDHKKIYEWIMKSATRIILISGIRDLLIRYKYGKILYREEFKYKENIQEIIVYEYIGENPME